MLRMAMASVSVLMLSACTAGPSGLQQATLEVDVQNVAPSGKYRNLGPITATHGHGCGLFGSRGDFEGAVIILREKAVARGANYVQIIKQQGEFIREPCLDRTYIIDGFAYKTSE